MIQADTNNKALSMVHVNREGLNLDNYKVDGKLVLFGKVTVQKPECDLYTTHIIFKAENGPSYCFVPVIDFEAFAVYSPDDLYDGYECPIFIAPHNNPRELADDKGVVKLVGIREVLEVCLDKIEIWGEVSGGNSDTTNTTKSPEKSGDTPPGSPPRLSTSGSSTPSSSSSDSSRHDDSTQALMTRLIKLTKEAIANRADTRETREEVNFIRRQIDLKLRSYTALADVASASAEMLNAPEAVDDGNSGSSDQELEMLQETDTESSDVYENDNRDYSVAERDAMLHATDTSSEDVAVSGDIAADECVDMEE